MTKQPTLFDAVPELETPIMRDILVAVTALPETMAWRHNTGVARTLYGGWIRFGLNGSGDLIGCHRGRAIAIETKRQKGGRFSDDQQNFARAWRKAGGIYIPARSVDEALAGLADIAP